MNEDRRRQNRAQIPIDVVWKGTAGKSEARVTDISPDGCFVDTIARVAVGEIVDLTFLFPDGEPFDVRAEVAYELPRFGFGVSFKDLSETDFKRIEQLVNVAPTTLNTTPASNQIMDPKISNE